MVEKFYIVLGSSILGGVIDCLILLICFNRIYETDEYTNSELDMCCDNSDCNFRNNRFQHRNYIQP